MSHPNPTPEAPRDERRWWLDDPANVKKIVWALAGVCGVLLAFDLLDRAGLLYHRHTELGYETWFGFDAFFGFLAYAFIVTIGKLWRKVVKREEGYYGE